MISVLPNYIVYTIVSGGETRFWHIADSYLSAVEWVDAYLDEHYDELLERAIEHVVYDYNYFEFCGPTGDPEDCTEAIDFEFEIYHEKFHIGKVWETEQNVISDLYRKMKTYDTE